MKYVCLICGYSWDASPLIRLGYHRCPNLDCRSYDVAPASFPQMVKIARRLGINRNTPIRTVVTAFRAVWGKESLLLLGVKEFSRIMDRVIREVESGEFRQA